MARELYRTRRTVAKALGLKWGAYHLARPGNPIDQANHFVDFADPPPDDRVIYIQNGPQQNAAIPHFDGVRVPGYTYVEYVTGFVELYDLTADPYQLSSIAGKPSYAELEDRLAGLLRQVRDCHGDSCREPRFTPPG